MPIDYDLYPPNWKSEIVPRIRKRDKDTCTICGKKENREPKEGEELVKCGVAHLDHDEENWEVKDERLAVICDPCHFKYDRPDNMMRIKYGKRYRQSIPLLPFKEINP